MFSSANINPMTGVRYGVISTNSLDLDLVNDLFYNPEAEDVTYNEAYEEARKEAESRWDEAFEEARIAAEETDPNMTGEERERFVEKHMVEAGICWTHWTQKIWFDRDDYVERELERFSDCCQIDEPEIVGELDGVKYRISYLGGAALLWVIEGPVGYAKRLCSPCVPNAGDLDGGFYTQEEFDKLAEGHVDGSSSDDLDDGWECYVVPRDWLAKED